MRDEKLRVISILDPAIDKSTPDKVLTEYVATRDFKVIAPHIIPGQKPTVFVLREIAADTYASYVGEEWGKGTARRALKAALMSVEQLRQRNGITLDVVDTAPQNGLVTDQFFDERLNHYGSILLGEIGRVAWEHSGFPRWIESCFAAPDSCLELLGVYRYRSAVASQNTPASSSVTASSNAAETQATPEPITTATVHTGEVFASATAATATATDPKAA